MCSNYYSWHNERLIDILLFWTKGKANHEVRFSNAAWMWLVQHVATNFVFNQISKNYIDSHRNIQKLMSISYVFRLLLENVSMKVEEIWHKETNRNGEKIN